MQSHGVHVRGRSLSQFISNGLIEGHHQGLLTARNVLEALHNGGGFTRAGTSNHYRMANTFSNILKNILLKNRPIPFGVRLDNMRVCRLLGRKLASFLRHYSSINSSKSTKARKLYSPRVGSVLSARRSTIATIPLIVKPDSSKIRAALNTDCPVVITSSKSTTEPPSSEPCGASIRFLVP